MPGTHFVRGKMKTSASIKSRFTRSAYLWRLQQLNNCCRVSPLWLVCAVVCLLAFFSAHSSPVCSNFFPAIVVLEVHDRFDQQTNLDEREKMRTHKHTHSLSLNRHTNKTPVFSALSSNECSIVCFSEMLVTSERANESKRAHLKLTELHKTIGNSLWTSSSSSSVRSKRKLRVQNELVTVNGCTVNAPMYIAGALSQPKHTHTHNCCVRLLNQLHEFNESHNWKLLSVCD